MTTSILSIPLYGPSL